MNTIIYMIPSLFGLTCTRFFSVILASLTVLLTTLIAQKLEIKQLFLIPMFLWFQPWFNHLSFAVITEVPFYFCLILGLYFWLNKKEIIASVPFGLLFLIRHEGIALLAVWCMYALFKRKWKTLFVGVLPFILFNLIYFAVLDQWAFNVFFNTKPTSLYGAGSWFHFVLPVVKNVGIPIIALSIFSLIPILKLRKKWLIFLIYFIYFMIHTLLYRFGLFASGGYDLFLVPLAPGFALAAVLGFNFIISLISDFLLHHTIGIKPKTIQILITVSIIILVIFNGTQKGPYFANLEQLSLKQAAKWIKTNGLSNNRVVSTHVWFYYYFDLPLEPEKLWTRPPSLDKLEIGTIVVWDRHYSNRWGLLIQKLLDKKYGWQALCYFGNKHAIIFQKVSDNLLEN